MHMKDAARFADPMMAFRGRLLSELGKPAGYAALIDAFGLEVPLPIRLSAIGASHRVFESGSWRFFTPRHEPEASIAGHLIFALKNEGLDLAVLRRLFMATGPDPIVDLVRAKPTSSYARRLWFLYEWLLEARLDLPDADRGNYVSAVDPEQQFAREGALSQRHRVRDNLPGTVNFCPLVFRTPLLASYDENNLRQRAQAAVSDIPLEFLARASASLLLKDTRSSYAIEGEHPALDRLNRWGRAISEAGQRALDMPEFLRLQRIVIEDARFLRMGLRSEGGFVGIHERDTMAPIPDHISAKAQDLEALMNGLVSFDAMSGEIDPIIAAAALAFGFVYIHPFEDGNGRLHRYLIHHIFAKRYFMPPSVTFPVSAAILEHLAEYRATLETYSRRLLPCVKWRPTSNNNIEVLNDTLDFYRYFDATPHAEFLYRSVVRTIEYHLPREVIFLYQKEYFHEQISHLIDLPERRLDLLWNFLQQNKGKLSRRAQNREFAGLTAAEARRIEEIFEHASELGVPTADRSPDRSQD
jgi:hypothetical protein